MPLAHAILKTKQRELRAAFPETMGLRVHCSISWIGRAEQATDDDGRFILLWIAFNAAYADEEEFQIAAAGERAAFASYFRRHSRNSGNVRRRHDGQSARRLGPSLLSGRGKGF